MERVALVGPNAGHWRLYVCPALAAPSEALGVDVLEADEPTASATAEPRGLPWLQAHGRGQVQ
jgi:hypothetical protein